MATAEEQDSGLVSATVVGKVAFEMDAGRLVSADTDVLDLHSVRPVEFAAAASAFPELDPTRPTPASHVHRARSAVAIQ